MPRSKSYHVATRAASALVAASLAFAAACSSDSATTPTENSAKAAVEVFTALADSVARTGGDSAISDAYASLAEAVRVGGRISPVVITIDGTPTAFLATAMQTVIDSAPCAARVCAAVVKHATFRSFIAWQQDNPRRVVQIASEADSVPIRAYLHPLLVPYAGPSASLVYLDGNGGMFFGTSGSQKLVINTSATPCAPAAPGRPGIAIHPAPPRCTQADFSASFSAKAEASPFLSARSNATGSHTLSMSTQPVLGALYQHSIPALVQPPVRVTPHATLPATMRVTTDRLLTLTLTVSNPTSAPVTVQFSSGQQYDFKVSDATTGASVWTWSADKLFIAALTSVTIPAHGTFSYAAHWTPTRKGNFVAEGTLVGMSHRASARAAITIP